MADAGEAVMICNFGWTCVNRECNDKVAGSAFIDFFFSASYRILMIHLALICTDSEHRFVSIIYETG